MAAEWSVETALRELEETKALAQDLMNDATGPRAHSYAERVEEALDELEDRIHKSERCTERQQRMIETAKAKLTRWLEREPDADAIESD